MTNVADIAIHRGGELRRVGVTYPDRLHAMDDAIRLYEAFGIACDLSEDRTTMSYPVPRPAGQFYAGMFELFTGRIAYNEWLD